ncbi:MAG: hypothetical protein U5K28_03415 [Halobacteriales archaeon]|nr:hypothetical protein [Halobacteriales archaeon]
MSADDTPGDDPVATALTEGSAYDRLRVQRISVFPWSLAEKLQRLGVVLLALGAALGAFTFVPPDGGAIPADPGQVPTYASLTALTALAALALAALVLSILGLFRDRNEPLSDQHAETMLVVEEMCGLVGFVTGGTITAIAVVLCLLPFLGADGVAWLARTLARSPYAPITTALPAVPSILAPIALLLGVFCLLAGHRWRVQ